MTPRRRRRFLGITRITGVIGLLAVTSVSVRAEFRNPVAIKGATIVSADAPRIENGIVLIVDGRIVEVGPDVVIPPHAEVIDASGMFAYPGFISAHDHLGITETPRSEEERRRLEDENPDPKQRAFSRTHWAHRRGVHSQWRAEDAYTATEELIDKYRKIGFTTMLVAPRGGIFGGTSAVVSLMDAPLRRVINAVNVAQHAGFNTDEPGEYPESLLGVFALFRQVLLDTAWSVEQERYFERHPRKADRPPVDAALQALRPVLSGATRVVFAADTEHGINRALNLAKEFNLRAVISGAKEAYKVIDRLKSTRVPVIVSLKFEEEPEYGKKKKADRGGRARRDRGGEPSDVNPDDDAEGKEPGAAESADEDEDKPDDDEKKDKKKRIYEPLRVREERRRLWEEHATNVIRLHEAGVAFSFSTRDFEKPSEFLDNLRLVIERGLPAEAALRALTTTPADVLGLSDQIGRIEAGALGNVVVMSGPFEKESAKVRFVIVEGRKTDFDRDQDDEKKDGGEKKGDKPDDAKSAEASVSETPDDDKPAEKDESPVFASEIEADREPKTKAGGNVFIQNATLLPVSSASQANTSILIENGKITAIGSTLTAPAGTTVIDATGLYVLPGMIDAHSHMGISAVNDGPHAISAEVRIGDLVYNDTPAIYRALAGGVTTTHAMHGSANPIGGQNVIFKLKYRRPVEEMILHDAPRTIKFALGENVKQSNAMRILGNRFPAGRMGVEAVIRDAFTAGRGYQREWDEYRAASNAGRDVLAPRRDLRLEAMADILRGDLWIHSHCYRSDEILRLMHAAEDFGIRIACLQHVLEGYRIAPEIARHGASASTFANMWAYKVEAYGALPHNAALMTEHGIVSSVNSDSANTIRYLNVEAAKCIKWGDLDEAQALRLVTLNPAIQLGIDNRVGSLEVGKDGDVAIFNGHPLNSYARNVMALIEGEVFFESEPAPPATEAGALEWNPTFDAALPESPHRLFAIVGGTVHPVSGAAIENGVVVIRNDRIDAVGPAGDVAVPPGAGIVDAKGRHVYPGLIDAGGDLGLAEIGSVRATRDSFDIATFAPELRAFSAVHSHSEHIRIAHSGGLTTQLAVPGGATISGQSALIHLDGWTADEMVLVDGVGLHVSVPSLPPVLTGEEKDKEKRKKDHKKELQALEDFVEQAQRYAAAVANQDGAAGAAGTADGETQVDADLRLEAMIPYVRGEKSVLFSASSYKQILDTIEFAEKYKLKPIVYGGDEAWKLADVLAEKNIAVILGTVLSYPRDDFEPWNSIYACAAVLDKAGVRWCFATQDASGAYDLGIHAGMAVAHGLPPDRAIRALTLGAAEVLGVGDRLGTLEPGKMADVIVTTHEPTQTVSRVTHMFINGRPIDLGSMHTESYRKFKNRPAPALPPAAVNLVGPPSMTGR
ncbi:MAG: amidohydrolase family protein [Phycisphaerales bacterium]|nr:amidohydrolase family protein [Phycisphaerales bacterium]